MPDENGMYFGVSVVEAIIIVVVLVLELVRQTRTGPRDGVPGATKETATRRIIYKQVVLVVVQIQVLSIYYYYYLLFYCH